MPAIKKKSDTTEAMSKILANDKPILIQSDNGTEFLNNSFQRLLKSMSARLMLATKKDRVTLKDSIIKSH